MKKSNPGIYYYSTTVDSNTLTGNFVHIPRIGIFVEKYLSNGKEHLNLIRKLF